MPARLPRVGGLGHPEARGGIDLHDELLAGGHVAAAVVGDPRALDDAPAAKAGALVSLCVTVGVAQLSTAVASQV